MRKLMLMVLMAAATIAWGQQLDLKVLDKVASKATSSTEIGMDEATLKATSASLDETNPNQVIAKKTVNGLKGFFLRSYEFKKGDFKVDDIKPLMDQLKAPDWKRFLRNKEEDEWVEIWWHVTNGAADGMLLVSAENSELTVINALGISEPKDLAKLKDLGVPPGIPSINAPVAKE
jgi:hypothetical protein